MRARAWVVLLTVAVLGTTAGASGGKRSDSKGGAAEIPGQWAPSDIDVAVPPVEAVACPLDDILAATSRRVRTLVQDMQRFSAREKLDYSRFFRDGRLRSTRSATFTYVADIHEVRPGQLVVDEYRNDEIGAQSFPSRLATTGTAAFALIFHPDYAGDFHMTCEGLAQFGGRPAWQLHFVQRRSNNFRGYRVAAAYYPIELKGRAWIAPDSFEVLRLETDLLHTVPEIKLLREHVEIDYAPVSFPRHNVSLWLPQDATIYMDYRGHRYCHRHSFSDFQLFWVDTQEAAKAPESH